MCWECVGAYWGCVLRVCWGVYWECVGVYWGCVGGGGGLIAYWGGGCVGCHIGGGGERACLGRVGDFYKTLF